MNNTEGGFSPFIITYNGLNLEAKLHARKLPLTITRAVIGGTPTESDNEALNLKNIKDEITSRQSTAPGECATVDISRVQVEGNGIASMRVTVGSGDTPFTLCMIGIMAQDPDDGEILYMSASNARGDYFPGDKIIQANYDFVNILTQAEGVSVKPTLLSEVRIKKFISHLGDKGNPHGVTAEQVFPDNSDTLSEISAKVKSDYDTAVEKAHSHNNGSVLNGINDANVSDWNDAHEHTSKKDNPHEVTAKQVGLGNVPNVSTNDQTPTYTAANEVAELKSGEKLSTAFGKIAAAIKKFISHLGDKGNPHGVTKSQVGLSNVDNTSDTAKPVSTAQRTAINGVSDNLKTHIADKGNPHEVTPQKIGLGNVTNESKETMFTNPVFTGSARSTTPPASDRGTRVATTAFVQSLIDQVKEQIAEVGRNAIGAVYAQYLLGGRHYDGVSDFDDDKYLITYAERAAGTIDLGVYEVLQGAELPQPTPGKVYFGCCTDSLDAVIDDQVVCTQFLLYPNDTVYIRTAETWYYMDGVISHPSFGEWFETPYNISYFENHL